MPLNSPETAESSMLGMRMPGSSRSVTPHTLENCSRTVSSDTCRYPTNSWGKEPMSQEPCTLFCPLSGFTPTPRRPILPVAIAKLAMAITIVEPCECSVTPRP